MSNSFNIVPQQQIVDELYLELKRIHSHLPFVLRLQTNIARPLHVVKTILTILKTEPKTVFKIGYGDVSLGDISNHLNGGICGYNNSPFILLNSINEPTKIIDDIALIQCFYGNNDKQILAVELALMFMLLSNPIPREWIFVEAQNDAEEAKFRWVEKYGLKYKFVLIQNDRQDYFIKEQLWNIGAMNTTSPNMVFVDGDVSYCQTNWLSRVKNTFDSGCQLFQPNGWSWRASEQDGSKDVSVSNLNLSESFAHKRSVDAQVTSHNGHTGYDIAITREYYNSVHGFYALPFTGGDWLNWTLYAPDEFMSGCKLEKICKKILEINPIQKTNIGCSNLICFHNAHGSISNRKYESDGDYIANRQNMDGLVINNFNSNIITELVR